MTLRTDSPPRAAADLALAEGLFAAVGQLRRHGRRLGGGPFPAGTLSGAQVEVVRLVRRRPGLSVAEAAAELALAPNTVSTLVGQLAEAQVLTRVTDPQDRLVARLALTTPAKERVERWRDQRAAATAGAIADLDPSERAALERAVPIISRLAAELGPAPDAPGSSENQGRDD